MFPFLLRGSSNWAVMSECAYHLNVVIGEIPEEGLRIKQTEASTCLELDSNEIKTDNNIYIDLFVSKLGEGIAVKGTATTQLKIECSRCLEWAEIDVATVVEGDYFPGTFMHNGNTEELMRETNTYQGDILDIFPLIREQILLSLPVKPLCAIDCRGLCSLCGKNKNKETCECSIECLDPRLEILKQLKEKL